MKKMLQILCLSTILHVFGAELPERLPRKEPFFQRLRDLFSTKSDIRYLLAVANEGSNTISMFSVGDQGKLIQVGDPFPTGYTPLSVAFRPDGQFLAVGNYLSNTVSMFRVGKQGELVGPGESYPTGGRPESVAFSPDSQFLAVANMSTVSMFSVGDQGELIQVGEPFPRGNMPGSVAFSPDSQFLAVGNYLSNTVSMFSVGDQGELIQVGDPFPTGYKPLSVAFRPDGQFLAVANYGSNTISMFMVGKQGELVGPGESYPTGGRLKSVAFSPDSQFLAAANYGSNTVSMFSVGDQGKLIQVGEPFPTGNMPRSVAFTWYQPYLQKIQEALLETTEIPTSVSELFMEFAGLKVQMPFNLEQAVQEVEKQGITDQKVKSVEVFKGLLRHLIKYKFNQMAQLDFDQWIEEVMVLDDAKDIIQEATAIVTGKVKAENRVLLGAIIERLTEALG